MNHICSVWLSFIVGSVSNMSLSLSEFAYSCCQYHVLNVVIYNLRFFVTVRELAALLLVD